MNSIDYELMKDSEIDLEIAKMIGFKTYIDTSKEICLICISGLENEPSRWAEFRPTRDWAQGGRLLELNDVSIKLVSKEVKDGQKVVWYVAHGHLEKWTDDPDSSYGLNHLSAGMRYILKVALRKKKSPEVCPLLM